MMRGVSSVAHSSGRNIYRTEGTAARKVRTVTIPEEAEERIVYSKARRDRIERDYRLKNPQRKNKARILTHNMTISHMIVVLICISALAYSISKYLNVRSQIQGQQYAIMQLNRKLNDAKLKNEEEYDRIMGSIDIEDIKAVAMNELGMKYPDTSQIVEFKSDNDDYVRQYKDIPGDQK